MNYPYTCYRPHKRRRSLRCSDTKSNDRRRRCKRSHQGRHIGYIRHCDIRSSASPPRAPGKPRSRLFSFGYLGDQSEYSSGRIQDPRCLVTVGEMACARQHGEGRTPERENRLPRNTGQLWALEKYSSLFKVVQGPFVATCEAPGSLSRPRFPCQTRRTAVGWLGRYR
jgi:hypothetical protein